MVPEGGAGVQARVAQLHALDLQVAVTDARVLPVHHQHMVFGPVDSLGGVAGGAAQVKTFAGVEREHFKRSFHSHCQDRETAFGLKSEAELSELSPLLQSCVCCCISKEVEQKNVNHLKPQRSLENVVPGSLPIWRRKSNWQSVRIHDDVMIVIFFLLKFPLIQMQFL